MSISSASQNPTSTTLNGRIPAIFRDDQATFYSVAAILNGASVTIIDDLTSTVPEFGVFAITIDDATWGRSVGVFMISAGAIYELQDTSSKFAASDAGTFLRVYIASSDLIIKNSTGADLAAGAVRIYRLL